VQKNYEMKGMRETMKKRVAENVSPGVFGGGKDYETNLEKILRGRVSLKSL